jgi:hypothetical protein
MPIRHLTVMGQRRDVLAREYLAARAAAWDAADTGEPVLDDFCHDHEARSMLAIIGWAAFMAGSEWERNYQGRRWEHEETSA